jgi:hypothetical protein
MYRIVHISNVQNNLMPEAKVSITKSWKKEVVE